MCRKSVSVNFFIQRIRTKDKKTLYSEIMGTTLKRSDAEFIMDVIDGLSYKELAEKYSKTESAIGKWKRRVCEFLRDYYIAQGGRNAE